MTYRETAALGESAGGNEVARPDGQQEARQWTIKNVDTAIVEKARAAAKKRGMKISAWVALALEEAADSDLDRKSGPQRDAMRLDMEEILGRIEAMRHEERLYLDRIERDVNQLVRGQHGILTGLVSGETKK